MQFHTPIFYIALGCSLLSLSACNEPAEKEKTTKLDSTLSKASYSYGADIAGRLLQQGIELDATAFNQGVTDAFAKNTLALTETERNQAKKDYQVELKALLEQKQAGIAEKILEEGNAFLAENGKKDGVITTDSGLQYKVINSGDGAMPKKTDTVTTHYVGTLIDGREFDSSVARGKPASFPVTGVIKGWTEALQLMHVGDKWQLFIPSELAYGKSKRSELIQPNSTLIFEIELLAIK